MTTILIVDDEREISENLARIIDKQNIPDLSLVKSCISREAREILQTQIVDILLTDINMPGLNGFELARLARENNVDCKVIFLTGFSDFDYAYTAIKDGCDDFILKISSEADIIKSIKNVLDEIDRHNKQQEILVEAQRKREMEKPNAKSEKDTITYVKQYIWDNIHSDISLNLLSGLMFFSPAYLSRIFKQATGITITDYLLNVRIEKSKQLLKETPMKIQEISLAVGVDSPVYFGRIFKKATGFTPAEYRRSH